MASLIIQILVSFIILRLKVVFGQDYTYLGCFYDNNRRDVLPDLIYCDRSIYPYQTCQNVCGPQTQYCQSTDMTIELCRDICADQNMKFFGLQAGTQCLCGGFFAPYDGQGQPTGQNDTCSRPCSGNMSQTCGADFQASIYQITEPASDCFNPGYVLNGDQSQQNSPFYNASDVIDYIAVCPPPSIKNGAASINCTASGNWTNPPPTCTVRCATPTPPMHSNFSSGQTLNDSYAVDDKVLFDCDNDPSRTNEVLTCGYYGDWETVVTDCPEPTTTVTTSTQPTTTPQPTTTLPSTTTSTTSTTAGGVSGSTSFQTGLTDSSSSSNHQGVTSSTITGPLAELPLTSEDSPIYGQTGPSTTESTTATMSTQSSTASNTTPSPSTDGSMSQSSSTSDDPSTSPSSGSSSSTGNDASSSEPTATMMSSPGGQGTSTPIVTDGNGGTTADSGRNRSNDMDWIPIIIGVAAGVLLLILVIIVVSVCCSRKRKQKKKNIPFDPALGASFGNPAFEDDETEQSRRGFVQENDYGDRQTYDIGVSDYAMAVDETDRVPPDGKDSPAVVGNGVEDPTYAVVNKHRQGNVTSFKPDDHSVSWATLPAHHSSGDVFESNGHSSLIHDSGYSEAYYRDPNNQVATPL